MKWRAVLSFASFHFPGPAAQRFLLLLLCDPFSRLPEDHDSVPSKQVCWAFTPGPFQMQMLLRELPLPWSSRNGSCF